MDPVSRAQSNDSTAPKKVIGRPFKKGQSGNPGGRPKKLYITKILESYFKKSSNRKAVEEMVDQIFKSKRMASVLLLREAAERLEGKVTQEVQVSGTINQMTDEELLKRLEKVFGIEANEPVNDQVPVEQS